MWAEACTAMAKDPVPIPARCPHCQEERQIEQDPRTKIYLCNVCAKTWYR